MQSRLDFGSSRTFHMLFLVLIVHIPGGSPGQRGSPGTEAYCPYFFPVPDPLFNGFGISFCNHLTVLEVFLAESENIRKELNPFNYQQLEHGPLPDLVKRSFSFPYSFLFIYSPDESLQQGPVRPLVNRQVRVADPANDRPLGLLLELHNFRPESSAGTPDDYGFFHREIKYPKLFCREIRVLED
jgi:hypothetical protein